MAATKSKSKKDEARQPGEPDEIVEARQAAIDDAPLGSDQKEGEPRKALAAVERVEEVPVTDVGTPLVPDGQVTGIPSLVAQQPDYLPKAVAADDDDAERQVALQSASRRVKNENEVTLTTDEGKIKVPGTVDQVHAKLRDEKIVTFRDQDGKDLTVNPAHVRSVEKA